MSEQPTLPAIIVTILNKDLDVHGGPVDQTIMDSLHVRRPADTYTSFVHTDSYICVRNSTVSVRHGIRNLYASPVNLLTHSIDGFSQMQLELLTNHSFQDTIEAFDAMNGGAERFIDVHIPSSQLPLYEGRDLAITLVTS